MLRRTVLAGLGAAALPVGLRAGHAADSPGVTDKELRIGNTAAYSGPASAYGVIARTEAAVFKMINEQGGVGGRQDQLHLLRRWLQPAENGGHGPPPCRAG